MAPAARHETNGADSTNGTTATKANGGVGTRASKRNVTGVEPAVSPPRESTFRKKPPPRAPRTKNYAAAEASESDEPIPKKPRRTGRATSSQPRLPANKSLRSSSAPISRPMTASSQSSSAQGSISSIAEDQEDVEEEEVPAITLKGPSPPSSPGHEKPFNDSTTPEPVPRQDRPLRSTETALGTGVDHPAEGNELAFSATEPPLSSNSSISPTVVSPIRKATRGGYMRRGRAGRRVGVSGRVAKPKPAVASGTNTPKALFDGMPRARGKAYDDPKAEAARRRNFAVKARFQDLQQLQKTALAVLAEQSLKLLRRDAKLHETLPEFKIVSEGLKEKLDSRLAHEVNFKKLKSDLSDRTLFHEQYYQDEVCKHAIEDAQEEAMAQLSQKARYNNLQYLRAEQQALDPASEVGSAALSDVPFANRPDLRESLLWKPQKKLHPVATPYIKVAQDVIGVGNIDVSTLGDNEFEQHPVNYFKAASEKQKKDLQAHVLQARDWKEKGHGKKGPSAFALNVPLLDVAASSELLDGDSPGETPSELVPPSAMPSEAEDDETIGDSEKKTKKPSRKSKGGKAAKKDTAKKDAAKKDAAMSLEKDDMLKMDVELPFHFEEGEIGYRAGRTSTFIQPPAWVSMHNAMAGKESDYNQKMIAIHKLHPARGVTTKDSINPDYPEAVDGICPISGDVRISNQQLFQTEPVLKGKLPSNQSKLVIQDMSDGTRNGRYISRSEWIMKEDRLAEKPDAKLKMAAFLAAISYEDEEERLCGVGVQTLLDAAETSDAADAAKKVDEELAIITPSPAPRPTPRGSMAPPPVPTGASRQRYDPVRDITTPTTYQTPYPSTTPVAPPAPPPVHMYGTSGGAMEALADTVLGDLVAPVAHSSTGSYLSGPLPTYQHPRPPSPYRQNQQTPIAYYQPVHPPPGLVHYGPPHMNPPPVISGNGPRPRQLRPAPAPPASPSRLENGRPRRDWQPQQSYPRNWQAKK